jgi:cation-transporting ATPase 13A3/4/5
VFFYFQDRLVMPYVRSPATAEQSVLQAAPQRLLQFSSENQCMAVVCRVFQEQVDGFTQPQCIVYCKGSPEKIRQLCLPDTIPPDYLAMLDRYASHGYRILAIACKFVPVNQARMAKINKMTRPEIESELTFLGLIVLENRLKEASSRVLAELHGANVRPVMVTGDNILTAIRCHPVPTRKMYLYI